MTVALPRRIGAIRVLERLGEGGMAWVHRAQDVYRPDALLALKFLRPESAADPEVVARFLKEGELLKSLRHPHLVEVYDFGRAGSVPYLLMELLPGGAIQACRGEAPARIVARLLPVLDALDYAHATGVVHRDLKPSNLLFAADGRLKVTDFGVCLWEVGEGSRLTRSRMVVGTLGFMAPEQHGDPRRVDRRADVYALGALLYEFCTGQAWSLVQLPPAAARPGTPPRLAGILMRCLVADPGRRTSSMAVLAQELRDWLESAEAAGWGAEPLPGFAPGVQEAATVARPRGEEGPEERLSPYLDALGAGDVGSRRAAAEGLRRSARPGDGPFLLEALARVPEPARFALVAALGELREPAALEPLLGLLGDPYCRAEAAEALSRIAPVRGAAPRVLAALWEEGLGAPWRWMARARLGDPRWAQALERQWVGLGASLRLPALEAAGELPGEWRARIREATRDAAASSALRTAWEALGQTGR